jgi:DNA-directed RNA polymerase subunit H (RpoH/RPB5)
MDRPQFEIVINRSTDFETIVQHIEDGYLIVVNNQEIKWDNIPSKYHSFVFRKDELTYSPIDHERVPRHRLATQEEIDQLPRGQLPIIRTYDIVCRYLGFKENDIIAIERKSSVYYRRVVI